MLFVYHLTILSFRSMKFLYWKHPYFAFIQPTLNAPSFILQVTLFDTPSRFGSRRRHIQGVSSHLLAFPHVRWFPATVRPRVTEMHPSLTIRCFWSFLAVAPTITVLRSWNIKILKASLIEQRINKTQCLLSWLPYVRVLFDLVA
jgi:hypothetical protein